MVKESKVKGNSLGASGFTLGIVSILSIGLVGLISSVIGFIFCLVQQKKKPTKLAKAGLILNITGFVFSLLWIFILGPKFNQWLLERTQA
jgi:site-specific recombinase